MLGVDILFQLFYSVESEGLVGRLLKVDRIMSVQRISTCDRLGLLACLAAAFMATGACGSASTPEPERAEIAGPLATPGEVEPTEIAVPVEKSERAVGPPKSAAPGSSVWARRYGGADMDMGVAIALDHHDNIYLLGHYSGIVDFGTGEVHVSKGLEDVFLLKLDPSGHPLWSKSYGGTSDDYADDIAIGVDGGIYITGSFMERIDFGGPVHRCKGVHDVFLAKLDREGAFQWSKAYGDREDQICLRVAPDDEGGVFVAGYFRGAVKIGRRFFRSYPNKAAFVGRLDRDGAHLWSEQYGHIVDYVFPGMIQAPDGSLFYAGGSDPTRELTGVRTKRKPRSMDLGVVLARYTADGARLWRHRLGKGSDNLNLFVGIDPRGNMVTSGSFGGEIDFGEGHVFRADAMTDLFVAELDPNGRHLWSNRFGGARYQYVAGMAVDGEGNVFLTGQFDGHGDPIHFGGEPLSARGTSDGFVVKLNDGGRHVWSTSFGGDQIQFPGDMALDSSGRPVIVGSFSGLLEVGGEQIGSAGSHDAFVAVLRP